MGEKLLSVLAVAGVAAILAIGALVANRLERPTLVMGTSADYAPFAYRDAAGNLAGFDYEYGQLLCAALDADCIWQDAYFEHIFEDTAAGIYDLVVNSFTRTPEREAVVDFSEPYYWSYGQFVRKAGSGAELDGGSIVALERGAVYEGLLRIPAYQDWEALYVDGQEDAFVAVAEGRAGLTISDETLIDLVVNQSPYAYGDRLGDFERVGGPLIPPSGSAVDAVLGTGEIGIIMPKGRPELRAAVNAAIREVNAGAAVAAISEKYFGRNIVAR